jgi:hypothetical protein
MKNRKLKIFLILLGLVQFYLVCGNINQNTWFNATIWLVGFYFGANVVEGAIGKERPKNVNVE